MNPTAPAGGLAATPVSFEMSDEGSQAASSRLQRGDGGSRVFSRGDGGSQAATVEAAKKAAAALKKYSIIVMKMAGGFVKFVFEDCSQFLIQGSYLVKFYHEMSKSARLFTMASMSSSLIVSFAGPVSECCKARAMRKRLGAEQLSVTDDAAPEPQDEALLKTDLQSQVASQKDSKPHRPRLVLSQGDPESFLKGVPGKTPREHSVFGHRALVFSATLFWVGMAGVPFIFKSKLTCGADIPMSAVMYFFLLATCCTMCELYVMVHIEDGVRFILNFVERIRSCHNIMFTLSPFLSYVARFDTFSDIVFTTLLYACPPIHWISIHKVVIKIPFFPLATWALWTLVIGLFFLQALPGLLILCTQTYLPMGLKLNEFNTLLAIIDENLEELPDQLVE